MTGKEQLYYMIEHFKKGEYTTRTFCELFTNIFNVETDKATLNQNELSIFSTLESYTCRFSDIEEDLALPNVYYDEKEIKRQIDIASTQLNGQLE